MGLDNATVRLGLDYGINKKFTIGAGRTTLDKTFDGYLKYQLLKQDEEMPISLTGISSIAHKTLKNNVIPKKEDNLTNRTSYSLELLVAKQFKERLGIQLSPTYVHRNLVATKDEKHDVFATGIALNYKLSHKVGVNLEWFYVPKGQLTNKNTNPLSLGVDLGTKWACISIIYSKFTRHG